MLRRGFLATLFGIAGCSIDRRTAIAQDAPKPKPQIVNCGTGYHLLNATHLTIGTAASTLAFIQQDDGSWKWEITKENPKPRKPDPKEQA